MILPISVYGTNVLKKHAEEIKQDYPNLKQLIDNMFETMYQSDGLGLAAPQVGLSIRIFVIDSAPLAEDDPLMKDFKKAFINPQIIEFSGEEKIYNEGCLSVPGLREDVVRKDTIRITYYDENFVFHDEIYDGTKSRIIQHEYDHLEGILFVERLSTLKKQLIKGKLNAISKGKFEANYKVKLPAKAK